MRFLFVGTHYAALRRELVNLGHECEAIDHWALFCKRGALAAAEACYPEENVSMGEVNAYVNDYARKYKPDVLVQWKGWINDQQYIMPGTIGNLKHDIDCLTVYWSVDDPDFVGHWQQFLSMLDVWDVSLSCCKASLDTYKRAGVKDPHYFLPGFDTDWPVDTIEDQRESVDLVIAGHPYAPVHGADMGRADLALAAKRAGFSVEVYGPDVEMWAAPRDSLVTGHEELRENYHGWLDHDRVWTAYVRGKVVLNNHLRKGGGYDPRYAGYCNDKIFQIAGTGGGAMLMDYQPGVSPEVLTEGDDYIQYRPSLKPSDCVESAMFCLEGLLADDAMRREISRNARRRTLEEHTWAHRAKQLIDICASHGRT